MRCVPSISDQCPWVDFRCRFLAEQDFDKFIKTNVNVSTDGKLGLSSPPF